MNLLIVNRGRDRVPRAWIARWLDGLARLLARRGHPGLARRELVVAFVGATEMRRLNREFRGKDYATDVLSFEGCEPNALGELVMCLKVVREQAKRTGLKGNGELGYMLIHGVLHLLGYDHETGPEDEARMFKLQDELYARLR